MEQSAGLLRLGFRSPFGVGIPGLIRSRFCVLRICLANIALFKLSSVSGCMHQWFGRYLLLEYFLCLKIAVLLVAYVFLVP